MLNVPVEVKDALKDGRMRKNYRIVVLNADSTEAFTIDNNTLVSESVSIDERMCSGDTIKFGLCEGSSLEFQYFNHPNITDRQVKVFCDVEYGANHPYTIPMGFFTVKKCSRQASTGIIKVTAYNKLQSDYLDAKANTILSDEFETTQTVLLADIERILLDHYQIPNEIEQVTPQIGVVGLGPTTYLAVPFYFTSYYGIESPINKYQYWRLRSSVPYYDISNPFYLGKAATRITYTISDSNDYWIIREIAGKLAVFEKNVEDRTRYFIDSARISTTETRAPYYGGVVTGQMLIDDLCESGYWDTFIGLEIVQNGVTKRYSTTTWEYENRVGKTHTVAGTINDFIGSSHIGTATIRICVPDSLMMRIYLSDSSDYTEFYYGWDERYIYWTDTTMGIGYVDNPPIKYGDGITDYISHYEQGGGSQLNIDAAIAVGYTDYSQAEQTSLTIDDLADFTLRDIVSASYETVCQFGQLDRVTDLFSGVELNHSRLYPQETLYPDSALYPDGAAISSTKAMYSQLWADEGNVRKWRNLIITYKGLDGDNKETEYTYIKSVNPDGTDDYICSDNWLFKNLVWTEQQIAAYANTMADKMANIVWFPFEMWCAGLPYLETGDEIEIPLNNNTYRSYVLRRSLKGIQNLQDTYINGTLDIF